MTQHFLKSAAVRDLTLYDVSNFSEEDAHKFLSRVRWNSETKQICPFCGVIDIHYCPPKARRWRCRHCQSSFSLMARTVFQDHKLSYKKILIGLMCFIHSANGVSNHLLARTMDVQIKTAQAFVGKLREAIFFQQPSEQLEGTVQIDGGYFCGRPRHGRLRRKRNTEAIKRHVESKLIKAHRPFDESRERSSLNRANWIRKKKRRVVMVLRELHADPGKGARRTIIAISHSENEGHITYLARKYVKPGSIIMTDENPAYNKLGLWFDHRTVEHATEFSTLAGVNDNQAESYFSRLRRYAYGVAHRSEPKYLADIATEMAWREDVRRETEQEKLYRLLDAVFKRGLSRWWRGYWQGEYRSGEIILD